jgi:hypothetical protein
MKYEDVKKIALEVFKIMREHQKKMKKYKDGKIFAVSVPNCSTSGSVVINNQTFSVPYKTDRFSIKVTVNNLGQIYLIPVITSFAFTVEQFEEISKIVNEAMKYAKELQENSEMLDLLDP